MGQTGLAEEQVYTLLKKTSMNVRKPIPADLLAQDICERRVRFESMNLCVITRCIKAVLSDIGADIQEHRSVAMACNPRQQVENLRLIRPEKEHFAIDVAVQPAAEAASKRARLERHWPRWTGELEETMSHTYTQPLPSCGYSDDSFNCCGHSPRARLDAMYLCHVHLLSTSPSVPAGRATAR